MKKEKVEEKKAREEQLMQGSEDKDGEEKLDDN